MLRDPRAAVHKENILIYTVPAALPRQEANDRDAVDITAPSILVPILRLGKIMSVTSAGNAAPCGRSQCPI